MEKKTAWYNARVGDTMVYKMLNNAQQTYTVVKVDDKMVTVAISVLMTGQTPSTVEVRMPRVFDRDRPRTARCRTAGRSKMPGPRITVSGQELTCKVTETLIKAGGQTISTKSWTSNQVPGGIVKTEDYLMGKNQVGMELIEFKRGG